MFGSVESGCDNAQGKVSCQLNNHSHPPNCWLIRKVSVPWCCQAQYSVLTPAIARPQRVDKITDSWRNSSTTIAQTASDKQRHIRLSFYKPAEYRPIYKKMYGGYENVNIYILKCLKALFSVFTPRANTECQDWYSSRLAKGKRQNTDAKSIHSVSSVRWKIEIKLSSWMFKSL